MDFVVPFQDPGQNLECYRAKFDEQLSLYVVSTLVLPPDAPKVWAVLKPSHLGTPKSKYADEYSEEPFPENLTYDPYWEDQSQYDLGLFAVRDPYLSDPTHNISVLQAQLQNGCEIDLKVLNDLLKPQSFNWADELDDLETSALQTSGVTPSAQQDGNSQQRVVELLKRETFDWCEEFEEESAESTSTPSVILFSQKSAPASQPPLASLELKIPPQLPSEEGEAHPEEERSEGGSDLEEGASGMSHDTLTSDGSRRFQESDTSPEPMSSPTREPSSDAKTLEPDVNTGSSGQGGPAPANAEASEEVESTESSSQASQEPRAGRSRTERQLSPQEVDEILQRDSFDWADECDIETGPPLQDFPVTPGSDELSSEEYADGAQRECGSPTPSETSQENSPTEFHEKLWNDTAFMDADCEYSWQSSRFNDCPDIHHFNWLGYPVMSRSDTPPEVSLFIILVGAKACLVEDYDDLSRQGVILRQAMKYIDPVIFDGEWWALEFRGHSLMKAITGSVHTFYTEQGTWANDLACTRDSLGWYDPMNPVAYLRQRAMPFNGWFETRYGPTRQDFFDQAKRMYVFHRKRRSDQHKTAHYKRSPLSASISAETGEVSYGAPEWERFVCGKYQFLAHPGDVRRYDPSSFYDIRLAGSSSSQQDRDSKDKYDNRLNASNAFVPRPSTSAPIRQIARSNGQSSSPRKDSWREKYGLPDTPNVTVPRPSTPTPDTGRPVD